MKLLLNKLVLRVMKGKFSKKLVKKGKKGNLQRLFLINEELKSWPDSQIRACQTLHSNSYYLSNHTVRTTSNTCFEWNIFCSSSINISRRKNVLNYGCAHCQQ